MDKKILLLAADEAGLPPGFWNSLAAVGYEVCSASDRETPSTAAQLLPDVIVLDTTAGHDAFGVREKLSLDARTAAIPVILLTAKEAPAELWARFAQIADDCLSKPFEAAELVGRIEAARARRCFYQKISTTDELTGFHNLHVYRKELFILFNIARRYKRPFSLALLDIDGLKSVNEAFGRGAGDFVLRTVADVMRRVFRQPDILIRYGEDEFVVLMPESGEAQAAVALRRLKHELESQPFAVEGAPPLHVLVSTGLAEFGEELLSENDLLDLAEKRLRLEKAAKRMRS